MEPKEKIHLIKGDIAQSDCEAIVNAANTDLWLGSGVAGAIHQAGGDQIQKECEEHGPIDLGEAAVTGGGNLKAKYVIHAASMDLDHPTTEESLFDSVKNSLRRAEELGVKSLAFPAIGTGVAGFEIEDCAAIMIDEILRELGHNETLEKVEIVLFDEATLKVFQAELGRN